MPLKANHTIETTGFTGSKEYDKPWQDFDSYMTDFH